MSRVDDLKTQAEITNYEETTRYDDVMHFIYELERRSGGLMRVETFGQTEEGRAMPLMIFGESEEFKPTVFIMANIHAGEVEGKEAMLAMSRRLVAGDLKPLLEKLLVLVAPIYNADGNENISLDNRSDQFGPIGGVGTRENAKGLDLNRDYMKLESAEARALVGLFNRWNPHLTVDLHTTNGSYHGYHLTFSPTLCPNANPAIIAYERGKMLPAISKKVLDGHGYRTYFYGNFATLESMDAEILDSKDVPRESTVWRTFDHRPRFGNNYVGLRNRLTILSEAYSYLDFRERIGVTSAFVEEILKFAAGHTLEIIDLLSNPDVPLELGTEFSLHATGGKSEILLGQVEKKQNPRSGREMLVMVTAVASPVPMAEYDTFQITRSIPVPNAYVIAAPVPPGVAENLVAHGIVVAELLEPRTLEVESFVVDERRRADHAFQGHHEIKLTGHGKPETITFPAGSLLVRTAQPLGRLLFYLLDPESDDGLVTWGLLDGSEIYRVPLPV